MQVFSVHLNRICAIHRLRKSIHDVCLVGCVGEENAGKTTLIRKLLGLPVIEGAHKIEKATACPDVLPMPIHGPGGLKAWSNSPLLVDTPGMFDQRQEFADCAIKHLGKHANYTATWSDLLHCWLCTGSLRQECTVQQLNHTSKYRMQDNIDIDTLM